MFIWFMFRDSAGNPWQSGLERPSGAPKPAYATFSVLAPTDRRDDAVASRRARAPTVKLYVP